MSRPLAVSPPMDWGTPTLLVRACQVCTLAEVMHALAVEGGVYVTAWEHWDTRPEGRGVHECRVVHDRDQEQGAWGLRP